jgi:hypothetical protein
MSPVQDRVLCQVEFYPRGAMIVAWCPRERKQLGTVTQSSLMDLIALAGHQCDEYNVREWLDRKDSRKIDPKFVVPLLHKPVKPTYPCTTCNPPHLADCPKYDDLVWNARPKKDVHTEHCCIRHGCKYATDLSDKKCTVASGQKSQSFMCEYCSDELYESGGWETAHSMNEVFDAGRRRALETMRQVASDWAETSFENEVAMGHRDIKPANEQEFVLADILRMVEDAAR